MVVKEALPLYKKGSKEKAVLIIHGYTGYTGEFYDLANQIHQLGYTVSLPRLPGHGTNKKDFKSTGWREWLGHVENCYMDLEAGHDEVYIVGLSMGGILALILSSRFNPVRTVLLAPGMAVATPLFYFTPFLKFFVPELKKETMDNPNDSEDRKILKKEYWSSDIPGQIAHVLKLQKIARRELSGVKSPLLLMLSEKDETVPLRAGEVIESGLRDCPLKKEILKESGHVLIADCEKDYVKKRVIDWLERGE